MFASAFEMTRALELLPSIGEVSVNVVPGANLTQAWVITFLNDLGDLPMLTVTRGRVNGTTAGLRVVETQPGTPMTLVYDGACVYGGGGACLCNGASVWWVCVAGASVWGASAWRSLRAWWCGVCCCVGVGRCVLLTCVCDVCLCVLCRHR